MTVATFNDLSRPTEVPDHAVRFGLGEFAFNLGDAAGNRVPFSMLARSNEPIDHYYWGRCVHDFGGMKLNKDRIVVDYNHDDRSILGYADGFEQTAAGLVVSGFILRKPNNRQHVANEILDNAAEGVPYEASIFFDPVNEIVVEYVGDGATVNVNGGTFDGPGVVFRKWTLKAVTVCPHGYDYNARTYFQLNQSQSLAQLSYMEHPKMTTNTTPPGSETKSGKLFHPKPTSDKAAAAEPVDGQLSQPDTAAAEPAEPTDTRTKPTKLESVLAKLKALEGMLSQPKPTADPLDAISERIEALAAKLSGGSAPDVEPGQLAIGKLSAKVDQVLAKFAHLESSSNDPASGGEGGPERPTFHSMFKINRAAKPKTV